MMGTLLHDMRQLMDQQTRPEFPGSLVAPFGNINLLVHGKCATAAGPLGIRPNHNLNVAEILAESAFRQLLNGAGQPCCVMFIHGSLSKCWPSRSQSSIARKRASGEHSKTQLLRFST